MLSTSFVAFAASAPAVIAQPVERGVHLCRNKGNEQYRLAGGVTPSTVGNYPSHLGAVFAVAGPAWAYPLDRTAMKDAFAVAKRLGIASKRPLTITGDATRERLPAAP
jgi:hypothetical protein